MYNHPPTCPRLTEPQEVCFCTPFPSVRYRLALCGVLRSLAHHWCTQLTTPTYSRESDRSGCASQARRAIETAPLRHLLADMPSTTAEGCKRRNCSQFPTHCPQSLFPHECIDVQYTTQNQTAQITLTEWKTSYRRLPPLTPPSHTMHRAPCDALRAHMIDVECSRDRVGRSIARYVQSDAAT